MKSNETVELPKLLLFCRGVPVGSANVDERIAALAENLAAGEYDVVLLQEVSNHLTMTRHCGSTCITVLATSLTFELINSGTDYQLCYHRLMQSLGTMKSLLSVLNLRRFG